MRIGDPRICATRASERYRSQGYTCSESTIRALADCFSLNIDSSLLKSLSTFSGGAVDDGRCGVLEAALAAGSIMLDPGSSDEALDLSRRLHRCFEETLGSCQCRDLFYPLYDEHVRNGLPEGEFKCVFQSGISAVAGVLDEIEEK